MANVDGNIYSWSATAANNKPTGATTIGTTLDDDLREIQKVVRQDLAHKGADIASATTPDIGAVVGLMHDITGTTAIEGLGTVSSGVWKILKFEDALTLTHNGTSLILPGAANITTANGDVGIFMSEGSGNWRCLSYLPVAYTPKRPVLATEQASTSGTSIDFTSIPSWVKKITVCFASVSTSGTSGLMVQIGDAGGVEATGYAGAGVEVSGAPAVTFGATSTGFRIGSALSAAQMYSGTMVLTLMDSANNQWAANGALGRDDAIVFLWGAGHKALSAILDRVRITTVGGADTFDAGSINIQYE